MVLSLPRATAWGGRPGKGVFLSKKEDTSMAVTEPIRRKDHVLKLAAHRTKHECLRNRCLILLGLFTALRVGDILRLTWDDVYDFKRRRVLESFAVVEKKTGKFKRITPHKSLRRALARYAKEAAEPGRALILNARTRKAISRVQVYRIIRAAAEALKLPCRVSCHSLRKTFGYHAWKEGASPAVIMEIYNHSSFAVTRRYLGVSQDDMNAVYTGLRFSA
jgi:integrase